MELLISYGALGVVALLAAMSPGPDFIIVSKNSIAHSRKIGIFTALGVGTGSSVHVTYTVLGLGLLISRSIIVFSMIKLAGAMYLMYLGVLLITQKHEQVALDQESRSKTAVQAFREGFLANTLNPKATLFFVSIFSQFVAPTLPFTVRASFGLETIGIISVWFVFLASALTLPRVRTVINRAQNSVMKVMGAALLLLGVRLASSQQ